MKKLARNFVLVSCIGSSVSAAPFLAIGDNAELFAVAEASATYNDNLFLDDNGKTDDLVFVLRPGFELQFGKASLVTGQLFVRETLSSYVQETGFNNQLVAVGGNVEYNPGGRLSLSARASFEELDQTVRGSSSPLLTDVRGTVSEREVTTAGVNGEFAYSQKFKFGFGVGYDHVNFLDATGVDSTAYTTPLNLYYELTPKVDLSLGVSYKHSELDGVDTGKADQFEDFYYNVGARGEFTPKLSGSFSVGISTRDANGDGADNDGTLGASASLSYAYSEKTQLSLALNRDFGNSSSSGDSFENTSLTLGASSAITADWRLNTSLTVRRLDYDNGTNDYFEGSAGAAYSINQHLTAGLSYSYRQQFAEGKNGNDFVNNVVSLTLSARY